MSVVFRSAKERTFVERKTRVSLRSFHNPSFTSTRSPISRPIFSDAVAAGLGAFWIETNREPSRIQKSSTSVPSGARACRLHSCCVALRCLPHLPKWPCLSPSSARISCSAASRAMGVRLHAVEHATDISEILNGNVLRPAILVRT